MAFALQELKVVSGAVLARHKLRLERRATGRTVLRGVTFAPEGETRLVVE